MLLRAKPAVVVVIAQVGAQVTLRCPDADKTSTPRPYRESGTGFLISPRGWILTNAHVVYVAHDPPRRWLTAHLVEKAFRAECLPSVLGQARPGPRRPPGDSRMPWRGKGSPAPPRSG